MQIFAVVSLLVLLVATLSCANAVNEDEKSLQISLKRSGKLNINLKKTNNQYIVYYKRIFFTFFYLLDYTDYNFYSILYYATEIFFLLIYI